MNYNDKRYILLQELKKGDWHSGTDLSKRIGITRAGISKHVQALRRLGYTIETQTNKGIRFCSAPNKVLPDEIKPKLLDNKIIGSDFFYTEKIDSTNIKAAVLAEKGATDGTVVLAEQQTSGKGRLGRRWESPEGSGIYCSIILRPNLALQETSLVTFIAAIAISEAINTLADAKTQIKWPNDILLNEKKIVGVLTEASAEMQHVNYIILGFGINVNTPKELLPPRIIFPASSMAAEMNKQFDRVEIVSLCLKQFDYWYNKLTETNGHEQIIERWSELSGMTGRNVRVEQVNNTINGTIEGVSPDGALLVKEKTTIHTIYSGDVKLI